MLATRLAARWGVQSSEMGYPLYKRLGFETVVTHHHFEPATEAVRGAQSSPYPTGLSQLNRPAESILSILCADFNKSETRDVRTPTTSANPYSTEGRVHCRLETIRQRESPDNRDILYSLGVARV